MWTIDRTIIIILLSAIAGINPGNRINNYRINPVRLDSPCVCDSIKFNSGPADNQTHYMENKKFFQFKAFSIQDSCVSINRFFDTQLIYQKNKLHCSGDYYPAFIVNEKLILEIETFFTTQKLITESAKYIFPNRYNNKSVSKKLYSYYRVYAGYIDNKGDSCIYVQFYPPSTFKMKSTILSKALSERTVQGNSSAVNCYAYLRKNKNTLAITLDQFRWYKHK